MKIATWNLESVRPLTKDRLEVFQSTMRVVNPDVWILTETWEDFTPGDKYQRVAVSRSAGDLKNSLGRCWVAIWAKLDLSAESLDNHGQKDRMACAICTKPGQTRVVVVGTVPLPWLSDSLWPGGDGFCRALASQATDWQKLSSSHRNCTLVVAGDFNQSLPYKRWYGSKAGAKALTEATSSNLRCITEGNNPLTGKPRIDHICIDTDSLKRLSNPLPESWSVPTLGSKNRPVTDHSGVSIDF